MSWQDHKIVYRSPPMRIGKHDWIVVVEVNPRYGLCTEYWFRGPKAPYYMPEEVFVPANRFWNGYDGNHHSGGMPKTLRRLYDRNKQDIRRAMAEGGGAC